MNYLPQMLFLYLAAVIVVSSLLVVTRKNPVHSVLFMLLMFFHVSALFLLLNAEFIAVLQMLVYAGAILVLFLFVIFLLNLKDKDLQRKYVLHYPGGAAVIAAAIFLGMGFAMNGIQTGEHGIYTIAKVQELTHTKAIGTVLYTEYLFPFEIASLVLLVAMVGAIVIAKKHVKQAGDN